MEGNRRSPYALNMHSASPGMRDQFENKRVLRHRRLLWIVAACMVLAVMAGAGAAVRVIWLGPLRPITQAELRLFNTPTRGNLASDQEYLQEALWSWHECKGTSRYRPSPSGQNEVRSDPRVLWAGDTPAGRAAVVGQFVRHQHKGKLPPNFRKDLIQLGFIDSGIDGRPVVVEDDDGGLRDIFGPMYGFLMGADASTLVFLDIGVPIGYTLDQNLPGRFTALEFSDGAAVISIPPQSKTNMLFAARVPREGPTTWTGEETAFQISGPGSRDPRCHS